MTTLHSVSLHQLAHGRAGDKGERSNISLIAWHPALWPLLVEQVTERVVAEQFASRHPSAVRRYLLPQLHAMNFVIDDVLQGGVTSALNLDGHGKCLSYLLLDQTMQVPTALLPYLVGPGEALLHRP